MLIDLSNLLLSDVSEIAGWFPIYDTMRGVRGELKLSVSISYFGKATGTGADSTDSVLFSFGNIAPPNMVVTQLIGFVEELLVDDDPEYDWRDPFRSSRTSNQSRQYLLYKLSAKLRREIGAKVVELGGNAVLGFKHHVDYESEGSLVMRGFGTAVTLKRIRALATSLTTTTVSMSSSAAIPANSPSLQGSFEEDLTGAQPVLRGSDPPFDMDDIHSPITTSSSILPLPENPVSASDDSQFSVLKMHAGDIQLLTISQFPPPTVVRLAGIVMAHSVKIVPKGSSEEKGRSIRDRWWSELRAEVKTHASFVGCQYILGYRETAVFYNDVILLTASGTAANLKILATPVSNPLSTSSLSALGPSASASIASVAGIGSAPGLMANFGANPLLEMNESDSNASSIAASPSTPTTEVTMPPVSSSLPIPAPTSALGTASSNPTPPTLSSTVGEAPAPIFGSHTSSSFQTSYMSAFGSRLAASSDSANPSTNPQSAQWNHNACGSCHIPYKMDKSPYKLKLERCGLCGRKTVPEILLATIEPPPGLAIIGQGQLIEAYDARLKKKGEDAATQIGEAMPFLEFDLYKQLMNKMRMLGMNACFKLSLKVSVGDSVIVGHMQATAMCLAALPRPNADFSSRERSSSGAIAKAAAHQDQNPRLKALLSQFTKNAQEAARQRAESINSPEFYPDNSLPLVWRRHHWQMLYQQQQQQQLQQFQQFQASQAQGGVSHSLEDVPSSMGEKDPHSILFHIPIDSNQQSLHANTSTAPPHIGIGGGGASLGELALGMHDHLEDEHDQAQSMQLMTKETLKEVQQPSYLVELENELDEDLLSLLISDPPMPSDFAMCSTQALPGAKFGTWHNMQLLTVVRIVEWSVPKNMERASTQLRRHFAAIFNKLHSHLSFRMHLIRPCVVAGIKTELKISDNDEIQVTFSGMVLHSHAPWKGSQSHSSNGSSSGPIPNLLSYGSSGSGFGGSTTNHSSTTPPANSALSTTPTKLSSSKKSTTGSSTTVNTSTIADGSAGNSAPTSTSALADSADPKPAKQRKKFKKNASSELIVAEDAYAKEEKPESLKESLKEAKKKSTSPSSPRKPSVNSNSAINATHDAGYSTNDEAGPSSAPGASSSILNSLPSPQPGTIPHVEITPLNYIPGSVIDKFIGTIHLSFIRESFNLREAGGMNVFTQNLILEAQRIARAHVLALGANVLTSYSMELTQKFKSQKNQGYCLLTITGDAVRATPLPLPSAGISISNYARGGISSAFGLGYRKLAKAQTRTGNSS